MKKTESPASSAAYFIAGLQTNGALKEVDIMNCINVPKKTVSRWATGEECPHPETQHTLLDLHCLVMRLQPYYKPEEIRLWFYAGHPQLDGRRPLELVQKGETDEVIAVLDRLDADAYL